jgi:hypothetical protein
MSRTTSRRLAAAAGVAVATAAAGAVLAAPASAAELRNPTLSYPSTVAPGQAFTLSGTGCFASANGTHPWWVEVSSLDVENGTGDIVHSDGTWSVDMGAPTQLGTYHWAAVCDDYTGLAKYPTITVTVTPDGKPVPVAATPVATPTPPKPTAAPGCSICKALDEGKAVTPGQAMTLKWIVAPFHKVTLVLHSTPRVLGTFTADANGVLTIPLTIPADVLGSHSLNLVDEQGTTIAALPLTVARTSSAAELAWTGTDVTVPLALGGALVVAGAGAIVLARRRGAPAGQA